MVGDAHYIYGIYKTAKEFADAGIATYFYRFSYEDKHYRTSSYKNLHGVPHGAEYKYLFKPRVGYFGTESDQLNQKDKKVQKKLLTMWKSFAENGNPTPAKSPVEWKKLGKVETSYLDIGETLTMKTMDEQSRMDTWDKIMAECKN
ncbi:carboxylesterase 4A-like [Ctenocephalides felis]|uniref:carboxylesterase 4A-like n=1 Tax=Ctenocephalides felis TaxID=7515 RepID=UPI000E6E2D11|nr:carboxylesterase 4A-like [Ctenocephalides felis]